MKYLTLGLMAVCLSASLVNGQTRPLRVQTSQQIPEGWVKIDLTDFSFYLPPEVVQDKTAHGIDSAVWRYFSDGLYLTIDFGRYSAKPSFYKLDLDYHEETIHVGKKTGTMATYRLEQPYQPGRPYLAEIYFDQVRTKAIKLSLVFACVTQADQETARKVFQTVKFK